MPCAGVARLLVALLPVASALITSSRPLLQTPSMALRRTVGSCCCGTEPDTSLPLLPKSGGPQPDTGTRSRLPAMVEAGPDDGEEGGQPTPVGLRTTLAVLILLATADRPVARAS